MSNITKVDAINKLNDIIHSLISIKEDIENENTDYADCIENLQNLAGETEDLADWMQSKIMDSLKAKYPMSHETMIELKRTYSYFKMADNDEDRESSLLYINEILKTEFANGWQMDKVVPYLVFSTNQISFIKEADANHQKIDYLYSGKFMYSETCPAVILERREKWNPKATTVSDSIGLDTVIYAAK